MVPGILASVSSSLLKDRANAHDVHTEVGKYYRQNEQSDAQIWKKVNKNLMNIGVPQTPVLIRRAKGTTLYVHTISLNYQ